MPDCRLIGKKDGTVSILLDDGAEINLGNAVLLSVCQRFQHVETIDVRTMDSPVRSFLSNRPHMVEIDFTLGIIGDVSITHGGDESEPTILDLLTQIQEKIKQR